MIGGDRIGDSNVIGGIPAEDADLLLAHERVVVDLGESLRRHLVADGAVELALGRLWRNTDRQRGRAGLDRVVSNDAADLFDQIVFDGDVLGSAPGRRRDCERVIRARDMEFEARENVAHLIDAYGEAELAAQPIHR